MPFFITLGLLVGAAAGYLLYQYHSRAFVADDAAEQEPAAREREAEGTLKAA